MAIQIFAPPVQPSAGGGQGKQIRPRFIENQFGDGYSQTAGDGLNNMLAVATLNWSALSRADAETIENFLTASREDGQPFLYRLPNETMTRAWRVVEVRRDPATTITDSISVQIKEVPDAE